MNNKTLGRIWLEGDVVKAEPAWLKARVGEILVMGKVQADGEAFMKVLPKAYKSGYQRLIKKE